MEAYQLLKKYFGYDSFRGGQQQLVESILNKKDSVGIMPTGAGKSICYQIPGMMLSGMTLVVSPLISLMKDQVDALRQSGIPADFINSTLDYQAIDDVLFRCLNQKVKLLYIAPERLLTREFLAFSKKADISMVTIDEAHCISQWGQDFRPSYLDIPQYIKMLETTPIISAFTATATPNVKDDIIKHLSLKDPFVLLSGFDRPNLYFEVEKTSDKMANLLNFLYTQKNDVSGIVYCLTRKTVEEVTDKLKKQGFSVARYHAGLSPAERSKNQTDFVFDNVKIIVATNAFGMGIDKSNVSFVVHYNMPKDLESYYQEAGRAGRDGSDARCLLLYSGSDVVLCKWMIRNKDKNNNIDDETEMLLVEKEYERLKMMTIYSTTSGCLRQFILRYFGETTKNKCEFCSNCNADFKMVDITVDAQKIMSCIYRTGQSFGKDLICDVLLGVESDMIKQHQFDKLSTFGISKKPCQTLQNVIDFLERSQFIHIVDDENKSIKLTAKAGDVLFKNQTLLMRAEKPIKRTSPQNKRDIEIANSHPLFTKLRQLRTELAKIQGVPSFVIFSDKTLKDICAVLPKNRFEFLRVNGIGEQKADRYYEKVVPLVLEYCEKNDAKGG